MEPVWDLTIRDRSNRPTLAVEVKAILGTSAGWAAQFWRNLVAHRELPNVAFLLLVFPDRFYLWIRDRHTAQMAEPDHVIDAQPILQPYFDRAGVTAENISGASLELIVFSWLTSVMLRSPDELENHELWLAESGLYDAVAGGEAQYEVVAARLTAEVDPSDAAMAELMSYQNRGWVGDVISPLDEIWTYDSENL